MRLSHSADLDDRLADVEIRLEMLQATFGALADAYDSSGPPSESTMRGLEGVMEEVVEEVNAIANGLVKEANARYLAKRPTLRKVIDAVDRRQPVRVKVQR
jgi:hypothetical protein